MTAIAFLVLQLKQLPTAPSHIKLTDVRQPHHCQPNTNFLLEAYQFSTSGFSIPKRWRFPFVVSRLHPQRLTHASIELRSRTIQSRKRTYA